MTNVVIVVRDGRVESVYSRNKNIDIELLDLDTQDLDEREELEKRLSAIENSKTYKDILFL